MGVYIKGMDMPISCRECPCSSWEGSAEKPRTFCHASKDHNETTNGRDACPLVEVPKHGRLIDADALVGMHRTKAYEKGGRSYSFHISAKAWVDNAPTVIEAEE